jgi:hypothetical protein
MKILLNKYLVLLAISCSILSCTEELSEEVKNGENLSEEQQEIVKFADKSIRLVSKSDEDLSHFIHKAGSLDEACEITAPPLGFDSANYDKTSSAYTADCILDVQEYDLFFNGADFEISVDEFLCEYVEYKPYRFFQYQPGSTTKGQVDVQCDDVCTTALPNICGKKYRHMDLSTINPLNNSLTPISTGFFALNTGATEYNDLFGDQIIDTEPLTCKFDYSSVEPIAGPNCDEGQITTLPIIIQSRELDNSSCSLPVHTTQAACEGAGESWTVETIFRCDDNTSSATQPTLLVDSGATSEEKCGGRLAACLISPTETQLAFDQKSFISLNSDAAAFTEEFKIISPFEKNYTSNQIAANFSRVCSSTTNTKTNSQFDTTLNSLIGHEVEDMPQRTAFSGYNIDETGNGRPDFTIYAEHLLKGRGFYTAPTNNVQPYYALNCLDQARDIKAQIRLFIREWDRTFSKDNSYIARLSDINQSTPLMDATGNQAVGEIWNDLLDLDDLIDGVFLDNQCQSLNYGTCYESLTAFTTEATCIAGPHLGTWYFDTCGKYDSTYTNEATCEAASLEWRVGGHCNDTQYVNEKDCDAAGEGWFPSDWLFPGASL